MLKTYESHYNSPTVQPEVHGLKQPHLSFVVNHSLNCFGHGHALLLGFYRKPHPLCIGLAGKIKPKDTTARRTACHD